MQVQRKKIAHQSSFTTNCVLSNSAFPRARNTITDPMFASLETSFLIGAVLLSVLGGLIKGLTGFAMPMVLVSGLGSFLSAELALAGMILPTLVTNLWQALRQGLGEAWRSACNHWRFLATSLIFIAICAQVVTHISSELLFLTLGLAVTLFASLQLAGWQPPVTATNRRAAEIGGGAFAGIFGGLAGIWGPPTVMYLTALDTPKTEHVRIQGVVYGTGAIALTLAHLRSGILSGDGLNLSVALVIPAIVGLAAGFAIQDRLNQDRFRWVVLIVLIVGGLNLIRRALLG